MRASNELLTDVDRNGATSRAKEEKRAPWRGYNKRSGSGWYLDTPRKNEYRSDTLTFPATRIDNISQCARPPWMDSLDNGCLQQLEPRSH